MMLLLSILAGLGVSFMLMFMLPAYFGTRVFNGAPQGNFFQDMAFWPFRIPPSVFGIENYYQAYGMGVLVWFLVYCVPASLLFRWLLKHRKINVIRPLLLIAMSGVALAFVTSLFTVSAKESNPDIRLTVLDKIQPRMEISEIRIFIPRKLYLNTYKLIRISSVLDGIEHGGSLNPDKVFLSDEKVAPKYQLELMADGLHMDYRVNVYFEENFRVCGLYYTLVTTGELRPWQDNSNWFPEWEHVRYSQILGGKYEKKGNREQASKNGTE